MLPEEGADTEETESALDAKMEEIYGPKEKDIEEPVTDKAQEEVEEVKEEIPEKEEPEKKEEVEEEEKGESEEDKPDDEQDPEKEGDDSEITLAELAAVLGAEESQFSISDDGKVLLNTKVDGVDGKVSLAEAIKSYQLEGHLNKQNMEVVETRKALESEREAFQTEHSNKLQQLDDTLSLAVNELNRDYQSIDWDQLKIADSNQFLILKNEYQERQASIQQSYQQLQTNRQQLAHDADVVRVEQLQTEAAKLREIVPGWDNEEAYKAGTAEVRQTLMKHGFSEKEVDAASNGLSLPPEVATRIFVLANKASMWDKLQDSQSAAIKKVRKAPKVVSGGVGKEVSTPATNIKAAVKMVKSSHGEKGLDDYLTAKGII